MARAFVIHNSKCLKCDAVNAEMVKVGPMSFCNDCFKTEFFDTGSVVDDNEKIIVDSKLEKYKDWLERYKEYYW